MQLKSNAVWHSLSGVECAYQSISAPSAADALMNVGHTDALGNHRMAGRYTITPGVLPTWGAAGGWGFTGTNYLTTKVTFQAGWSCLVDYRYTSGNSARLIGSATSGTTGEIAIVPVVTGPARYYVANGGNGTLYTGSIADKSLGFAGQEVYVAGIWIATLPAPVGFTPYPIGIGAKNIDGSYFFYWNGTIRSILIASRTLSPAEMWLASRQMAYCEQNPDWNAWARRRRYYYAPSAAAGRVGIYGARGVVALPGGVSIRGGNHG